MSVDFFNKRITDAQEKLFDSEVLVTGCVYDLLREFSSCSAGISAEIAYLEKSGGFRSFLVDSVFLEEESGVITLSDNEGRLVQWDEFDLSAKEAVMNELFLKYTSDSLYRDFSAKDEIH